MKINTDIGNNWLKVFKSIEELNKNLDKLPDNGTVVYTYGAWDLFHPGHVNFLTRARDLGNYLIVGVIADEPIRVLKGLERPIQSQEERMITVGCLRCVDAVIAQPEYDPSEQLKSLKQIQILTKGDDWDYIPGTETIEILGGRLIKLSYTDLFSTSQLVSKLKKVVD